MENLSEFLVTNPKQILSHLKSLMTNKCLISAAFSDRQSFLTAILSIDEKGQTLTIDCGPKEYLNKELLSSGIVNFKTEYQGISVLFTGREIKKSGDDGEHFSLTMKIPESIYWVQRRKSYRVRSPLSKNSYCSVTLQNEENQTEETHDFKLYDISVTGFSIFCESQESADILTVSTEYNNCSLVLEDKFYQVSFTIQSKTSFNINKPKKNQRIGCKFINTLPPTESAFLRYMQKIEREIKRNLG